MKQIALTGITGHLGAAVAHTLCQQGLSVRALVRRQPAWLAKLPGITCVSGDILDPGTLPAFLEGCAGLIHCAGVISIHGDPGGIVHRTNVLGTANVLQAAANCGVRRAVHVSSIHAYEQLPVDAVLNESRELVGSSGFPYDRSKREGQEVALSLNSGVLEVMVVNPTAVIGPYDYKPSRIGKVIIGLLTGRQKFITEGGFDFCDSRDVAYAILRALEAGRSGESYVLSGKWSALQELVDVLSLVSGRSIHPVRCPLWLARAALPLAEGVQYFTSAEPVFTRESLAAVQNGNTAVSSNKAAAELGYRARPLPDTLRDTYNWFWSNGFLN